MTCDQRILTFLNMRYRTVQDQVDVEGAQRQNNQTVESTKSFASVRSHLQPAWIRPGPTRGHSQISLSRDVSMHSFSKQETSFGRWADISRYSTICCLPGFLTLFHIHGPHVQQAWREKVTLCMIIGLVMTFVGYFTVGMKPSLCMETSFGTPFLNPNDPKTRPFRDLIMIHGLTFNFSQIQTALKSQVDVTADFYNEDISPIFKSNMDLCSDFIKDVSLFCSVPNKFPGSPRLLPPNCIDDRMISSIQPLNRLTFDWREVQVNVDAPNMLVIYNSQVLNLTRFFTLESKSVFQNVPNL
jgi:hypothetical protein